jgi:hypothetical protein
VTSQRRAPRPTPPPHVGPHVGHWRDALAAASAGVSEIDSKRTCGRLTRAAGLVLEAVGLRLPVGSDCLIELPTGQHSHGGPRTAEAEVVGFGADRLYLMPQSDVAGLVPARASIRWSRRHCPTASSAPARRASRDRSGCRLAMACSAACSMPPDDRSMASAQLPPPAKFRWPARRSTR